MSDTEKAAYNVLDNSLLPWFEDGKPTPLHSVTFLGSKLSIFIDAYLLECRKRGEIV
jgi:hypothetical protein